MAETGQAGPLPAGADHRADPWDRLAALQQRGADRIDPVRFRFIEALARRARGVQGPARAILDGKLDQALQDYSQRFELTLIDAREALARTVDKHPDAADELERLFNAGDFRALRQSVAKLENGGGQTPLADLTAYLGQHSLVDLDAPPVAHGEPQVISPMELKAVRRFRNTWSKLSVEQQLAQAQAQVPENAGPLNSHLLMLRSFQLMRDISPDYLNHFMSYVDTLLWLEQVDGVGMPTKTLKR
ncbi:MAG TPA: DUF2894 domain-containing protein [Azospira sp.]|nr:DUF2894 domain-containing protein [Azospira sp.]